MTGLTDEQVHPSGADWHPMLYAQEIQREQEERVDTEFAARRANPNVYSWRPVREEAPPRGSDEALGLKIIGILVAVIGVSLFILLALAVLFAYWMHK